MDCGCWLYTGWMYDCLSAVILLLQISLSFYFSSIIFLRYFETISSMLTITQNDKLPALLPSAILLLSDDPRTEERALDLSLRIYRLDTSPGFNKDDDANEDQVGYTPQIFIVSYTCQSCTARPLSLVHFSGGR